MSLSASPKPGGKRGGVELPYKVTQTQTWIVTGATSSDTPYTIVSCTDLPGLGVYDTALGICNSKVARRTESENVWEVDVSFASGSKKDDPEKQNPDPTARPAEYRWSTIHVDKVVEKDIYDNPVVNPAGDPYDPPIMEDQPMIGLTITRYEENFNPLLIREYSNKRASDSFMGFPAGEARCVEINTDPHFENGVTCDRVTYRFEFDEDKWVREILAQGGRYIDEDGNKVVATDENKTAHGGLVLLDADGTELTREDENGNPEAVYDLVETKHEIAFAPLGLEP